MENGETRTERDAIGAIEVPADVLWGANTARALENFGAEGVTTVADQEPLLRALIQVKIAAAWANLELGALSGDVAEAIIAAGREVLEGRWLDQFPLNLLQGGGGTSTNMNVNEVLATRASQLLIGEGTRVHPNDHVNRSQSTNDVYPTALALAVLDAGATAVADAEHLQAVLAERAEAFRGLERLGRTCLRDALPVTIDATFRAHAYGVGRTAGALKVALSAMRQLPLGATAVGTGAGAPDGYGELILTVLSEETGLRLEPAADHHDALANLDPLLAVAGALERTMVVAAKIAQDFRFLYSGPVGGIGELELPVVQPGSSMMPGKANPVIPEFVIQTSFAVRGARHAIECAVAAGELELNVMEPVIAKTLLEAFSDSGRALRTFADRCVSGLEWNREVTKAHLTGSLLDAVGEVADAGWDSRLGVDEEGQG